MVLFADESIEAEITRALRDAGHTVHSVIELSPSISDIDVLKFAVAQRAVLLTNDKDFGDLVVRHGLAHQGIVLLRCRKYPVQLKAELLLRVIEAHGAELSGSVTVITQHSVRIRAMEP